MKSTLALTVLVVLYRRKLIDSQQSIRQKGDERQNTGLFHVQDEKLRKTYQPTLNKIKQRGERVGVVVSLTHADHPRTPSFQCVGIVVVSTNRFLKCRRVANRKVVRFPSSWASDDTGSPSA